MYYHFCLECPFITKTKEEMDKHIKEKHDKK